MLLYRECVNNEHAQAVRGLFANMIYLAYLHMRTPRRMRLFRCSVKKGTFKVSHICSSSVCAHITCSTLLTLLLRFVSVFYVKTISDMFPWKCIASSLQTWFHTFNYHTCTFEICVCVWNVHLYVLLSSTNVIWFPQTRHPTPLANRCCVHCLLFCRFGTNTVCILCIVRPPEIYLTLSSNSARMCPLYYIQTSGVEIEFTKRTLYSRFYFNSIKQSRVHKQEHTPQANTRKCTQYRMPEHTNIFIYRIAHIPFVIWMVSWLFGWFGWFEGAHTSMHTLPNTTNRVPKRTREKFSLTHCTYSI